MGRCWGYLEDGVPGDGCCGTAGFDYGLRAVRRVQPRGGISVRRTIMIIAEPSIDSGLPTGPRPGRLSATQWYRPYHASGTGAGSRLEGENPTCYLCSMPYAGIQVANELLELDPNLDHMKLQKLMYYANGWWLALEGQPLIAERPQVWRYGPVFRGLYSTFARFGHSIIGGPIKANPFSNAPEKLTAPGQEAEKVRNFLQWILQEHGSKTAIALSDETHAPGTPWRNIAEKNGFVLKQNTDIPLEEDRSFFIKQAMARGVQPVQV
jgi:uncharacterized phage-associated protein